MLNKVMLLGIFWTFYSLSAGAADAENRLIPASLFKDHMVLQQNTNVNVWGRSGPGLPVIVTGSWITPSTPFQTISDSQGKWSLKLPTHSAGGPFTLTIKSAEEEIVLEDILIGEVWLCAGQSNMEFGLEPAQNGAQEINNARYPGIRIVAIQRKASRVPVESAEIKWQPCSPESILTAGSWAYNKSPDKSFSAVGYFFGRELHKELNVPVGLIQVAFGGTPAETWMQPEWLPQHEPVSIMDSWNQHDEEAAHYNQLLAQWSVDRTKAQENGTQPPAKPEKFQLRAEQYRPGTVYNGMLAPLVPFTVRGVIWYQGESNVDVLAAYRKGHALLYRDLFTALIDNWRNLWSDENLPFYFVQIAPWNYKNPEGRLAAVLRESQLEVMKKVKNTGMVVTSDIGDLGDIHPANKQDVGKRLALWALAKTYHRNIEYSGPVYSGFSKEDSAIRISFDHIDGGLVVRGGKASCWEIAGINKVFYPATATIDGITIRVSSDKVAEPEAVRFGFTNGAEPNLFNKAGLPASPFRTDDWPLSEAARETP